MEQNELKLIFENVGERTPPLQIILASQINIRNAGFVPSDFCQTEKMITAPFYKPISKIFIKSEQR